MDPELADLVIGHLRHVVTADEDPTPGDDTIAWQIADRGIGRGGLAAAGFADESVRLPGSDLERDAAQNRPGIPRTMYESARSSTLSAAAGAVGMRWGSGDVDRSFVQDGLE